MVGLRFTDQKMAVGPLPLPAVPRIGDHFWWQMTPYEVVDVIWITTYVDRRSHYVGVNVLLARPKTVAVPVSSN